MPVAETTPSVHEAVVVDRREPAPAIVVLGFDAPELAANVRAGQFAMVPPPGGEHASVPLAFYEAAERRISLMIFVVGPRTATLAVQQVGAHLTLLGPLGNGFDVDLLGTEVAIIAGGVGVASLFLLAEAIVRRGNRAHLYYGARTAQALVDMELFAAMGVEISVATDDGTRGYHGYVTDLFAAQHRPHSGIAACGPTPMLRSVSRIAAERRIGAQLSLEEAFACGVGACWGCAVGHAVEPNGVPRNLIKPQLPLPTLALGRRSDGAFAYVRICREGPVFWAHELRW